MKIKDDDLADLREFEEQLWEDWPEDPGRVEESRKSDRDDTPDSSDDMPPARRRSKTATAKTHTESDGAGKAAQGRKDTEDTAASSQTPSEEQEPLPDTLAWQLSVFKWAKLGLLGLVIVSVLGLAVILWQSPWLHGPRNPLEVRHAIPHRFYHQRFNFFILAKSARGTDLIRLGVGFDFCALNAYQQFQKAGRKEKDLIFDFLQQVHPEKNTLTSWNRLIDKNLLAYFRNRLPHSGIESIHITYLDCL